MGHSVQMVFILELLMKAHLFNDFDSVLLQALDKWTKGWRNMFNMHLGHTESK